MTVVMEQRTTLEKVLTLQAGSRFFRGSQTLVVGKVCRDSRQVTPGCIFVAIPGSHLDGVIFIDAALEAGAAVIVTERAPGSCSSPWVQVADARAAFSALAAASFDYPDSQVNVIGITGTNGKSTVASILQQLLKSADQSAGLLGTVFTDDTQTQTASERTTPEAPEVHGWLRRLADLEVKHGVMEVSSHSLVLKRVAHVEVAGAIFTNLSRDHLDFHGDMEQYFSSKKKLFLERLVEGGYAVLPSNDSYAERLADELVGHPLIRVGKKGDFVFRDAQFSTAGITMTLEYQGQSLPCQLPMLGPLNLENFMLAAGAALMEGVTLDQVILGAKTIISVPGRFERIEQGQPFSVVVDFAHTDDALRRALQALRPVCEGRLITMFGCGGDRDTSKRPLMGAVALRLSDVVVITSDNPRGEDAQGIIDQVLVGLGERERLGKEVLCEVDRKKAIRLALKQAEPEDLVAFMGKGHEDYQEIQGSKFPFSDQKIARQILSDMGFSC